MALNDVFEHIRQLSSVSHLRRMDDVRQAALGILFYVLPLLLSASEMLSCPFRLCLRVSWGWEMLNEKPHNGPTNLHKWFSPTGREALHV